MNRRQRFVAGLSPEWVAFGVTLIVVYGSDVQSVPFRVGLTAIAVTFGTGLYEAFRGKR